MAKTRRSKYAPGSPGPSGYTEAAMTMGSSILAEPIAGWGGILASPLGADKAAEAVEKIREGMTYMPRKEEGMDKLVGVADTLEPVGNFFEAVGRGIGDPLAEATGSPAMGAAGYTLQDLAMALPGLAPARYASKYPNVSSAGKGGKQRGMLAGPMSKTADLKALEKAKEMKANGANNNELFLATGWREMGQDGWVYEIPDTEFAMKRDSSQVMTAINELDDKIAEVKGSGLKGADRQAAIIELLDEQLPYYDQLEGKLSDFVDHPKAFEAYPELADMPYKVSGVGGTATASYVPRRWGPGYHGATISPDAKDKQSATLHEAFGHGVQDQEGWVGGSNLEEAQGLREAALNLLSYKIEKASATPEYKQALKQAQTESLGNRNFAMMPEMAKVQLQEAARGKAKRATGLDILEEKRDFWQNVSTHRIYEQDQGEASARMIQGRLDDIRGMREQGLDNPAIEQNLRKTPFMYDLPEDELLDVTGLKNEYTEQLRGLMGM